MIEAAVGNPHVLRGLASRKEVPLHGQAIVASAWALVAATAGRVELARKFSASLVMPGPPAVPEPARTPPAPPPITRASGKKKVVLARYVRNKRLADALHHQVFSALNVSPGARAYYDALRDRDIGYSAALRQLGNRLVGILHGCIKTHTPYNEALAWHQHTEQEAA